MLKKNSLRNRRFILITMVSFLSFAFSGTVFALSRVEAKRIINKVVDDINMVIASAKNKRQMMAEFESIFDSYADVSRIAKAALGREARNFSQTQLTNFTKVFKSYIAKKYGSRFREFIGGRIDVISSRKVKRIFEVKTTVALKNQEDFEVIFLVWDRSGRPLFFDIVIEGISMVMTERTEIGSMLELHRYDIEKLIADLKIRASSV